MATGDVSLDEAPEGFWRLLRSLEKHKSKTTRAASVWSAVRELHTEWHRDYRPRLAETLGDHPGINLVDAETESLRRRSGTKIETRELRQVLRVLARELENEILPDYEAARWTEASAPPAQRADMSQPAMDPLVERLEALSPGLARGYRQALRDLGDESRESYLGTAGELREVLRGAITALAPGDDAIMAEPWFKGHEGRPTQAERIRYVMQERAGGHESAANAADLVEEKTGALGRDLYKRASQALHARTERDEVEKIELYIRGVLLDVLPPLQTRR